LGDSNRQRKPWIEKPKCQASIDGQASAKEAKATGGGNPEGRASIEEAEAQASEREAKVQEYQDKKTENCLYAVVVGELEERSKPKVQ